MAVKDIVKDNKKFLLLLVLLVVVCIMVVLSMNSNWYDGLDLNVQRDTYTEAENVITPDTDYKINIKTVYGNIVIDLFEDDAPKAVNSLLFLIGERYYEGLTFHKVISNFVIQAGDTTGTGEGNPGYEIPIENKESEFGEYSVGMANASQFFIVLPNAEADEFNGKYTLVGEVEKGFDVVDSIAKAEVDSNYKPINKVSISSIQILEN